MPCRIPQPAKAYLHTVLLSTLIPRRGDADTRRPCWAIYPAGLWFHWAGGELLSLCVSLCVLHERPKAQSEKQRLARWRANANQSLFQAAYREWSLPGHTGVVMRKKEECFHYYRLTRHSKLSIRDAPLAPRRGHESRSVLARAPAILVLDIFSEATRME